VTDLAERARLGAQTDWLITADAPAIPWLWGKVANIASPNVVGVVDRWAGTWNLSFTSLR
jgi:hypothetical protein